MRTYDDYVESRQEMPDIAKAEDALSALLKRIDNSELRDAIDRAAGHVAYLREKSAFEAGQKAESVYFWYTLGIRWTILVLAAQRYGYSFR